MRGGEDCSPHVFSLKRSLFSMSNKKATDWLELAKQVYQEVDEWRAKNPKVTFNEIEHEVAEKLFDLRAKMLEELALKSASADMSNRPAEERIPCPQCGRKLRHRGKQT